VSVLICTRLAAAIGRNNGASGDALRLARADRSHGLR